MTTRKQLRAEMIKRRMAERQRDGNTFHSEAERNFNAYQESRRMGLIWDVSLNFYDIQALKYLTFQCDFLRISSHGQSIWLRNYDVDFEIDGEGHKTKWDKWKDGIKNLDGLKVIHIPGIITSKKWWPYLDIEIGKALNSKEMLHFIAG